MNKLAVILPIYKNDKVPMCACRLTSILHQTWGENKLIIRWWTCWQWSHQVSEKVRAEDLMCVYTVVFLRIEVSPLCWMLFGYLFQGRLWVHCSYGYGWHFYARSFWEADEAYLPQIHPEIDVVGGAIERRLMRMVRAEWVVYGQGPKECYEFFSRRNPHAHQYSFP